MIAIDLRKQHALDADWKPIQQINFTGNLNRGQNINDKNVAHYWRSNRNHFRFSTRSCEIIEIYFTLIWYQYKMTHYNTLNVKLSKLQLNKLKSGIKMVLK